MREKNTEEYLKAKEVNLFNPVQNITTYILLKNLFLV